MKRSILLLEDDVTTRELLLRIIHSALSGIDIKIYVTDNGYEALNIIRKHGEDISLFSTDVIHPGVESCALVEAAREKNPHVKIILLTGSVTIEEKCKELSDYLFLKPFTNEEYIDVLKAVFLEKG